MRSGALARALGGVVTAAWQLACGGTGEPNAPAPAATPPVIIVRLCPDRVEALDAAALDGLEAGVGGVYVEGDCTAACGAGVWASCRPFDDGGRWALIDCQPARERGGAPRGCRRRAPSREAALRAEPISRRWHDWRRLRSTRSAGFGSSSWSARS